MVLQLIANMLAAAALVLVVYAIYKKALDLAVVAALAAGALAFLANPQAQEMLMNFLLL